jgi:hypothetical protein
VNLGGYRVDVNRARLEAAPRYTASTEPNWSDRAYTDRVDQHWGVSRQSADRGMSNQRVDRIVAVFDSAERARAARNALMSTGISAILASPSEEGFLDSPREAAAHPKKMVVCGQSKCPQPMVANGPQRLPSRD